MPNPFFHSLLTNPTPLAIACLADNKKAIEKIIADIPAPLTDPHKLFCTLALFGHTEALKAAAKKFGFNANKQKLHDVVLFAALSANSETLSTVIELGAGPRVRDNFGRTYEHFDSHNRNAAHYAALGGNPESIDILLKLGINPRLTDRYYRGLTHFAAASGNPEADRALEAPDSGTRQCKVDPWYFAASTGSMRAIKKYGNHFISYDEDGVYSPDSPYFRLSAIQMLCYIAFSGNADALKWAAKRLSIPKDIKIVALEYKRGEHPSYNDSDLFGVSVLHYAAKSGNIDTIYTAFALGIDVKHPRVKLAILSAAESGNPQAIKVIAALGFETNVSNSKGDNVLVFATNTGNPASIRAAVEVAPTLLTKDTAKRMLTLAIEYSLDSYNPETVKLIRRLCYERGIDFSEIVNTTKNMSGPMPEEMKKALDMPVEDIKPTGITIPDKTEEKTETKTLPGH